MKTKRPKQMIRSIIAKVLPRDLRTDYMEASHQGRESGIEAVIRHMMTMNSKSKT